jgi:hypothetical protein
MTDSLRERVAKFLCVDLRNRPNESEADPMKWAYEQADRILAMLVETPPALAKGEEEISGDIMDDEVEKEWLDRVTSPAPAASEEEWPDIPDNMIRDKSTPRTRGET